jgi:hypothetical protein
MAEGKIEIKVGGVSFTGEGSETWLASQLDKMLKHLPELVNVFPPDDDGGGDHKDATGKLSRKAAGTLASFLNSKNAKTNQNRKFLATAVWLHDGGKNRLTTGDVSQALRVNNQGKLTNPSLNLNRNVGQGLCDKDGKQFYVTDEGRTEIG